MKLADAGVKSVPERSPRSLGLRLKVRLIVALVLMAAALALVWPEAKPEYGGITLPEWLDRLDKGGVGEFQKAEEAMRHFGKEAIPYLRRTLRTRDSWMMMRFWRVLPESMKRRYIFAGAKHRAGLKGLFALGETAELGIEDLGPFLGRGDTFLGRGDKPDQGDRYCRELDTLVPGILAKIGAPALPMLTTAILGTNALSQFRSATALFWIDYDRDPKPVPPDVITNLIKALDLSEWRLRAAATHALGGLRTAPKSVIPALEKRLADEHSNVRGLAAIGLGRFGASASNSIPKLQQLFDDVNPNTARYAREAVQRIQSASRASDRLDSLKHSH